MVRFVVGAQHAAPLRHHNSPAPGQGAGLGQGLWMLYRLGTRLLMRSA